MPVISGAGGGGGGGLTRIFDSTAPGAVANFDTGAAGVPAGYTGLHIIFTGRGDTAASSVQTIFTFNNDTGANYDWAVVRNSGGTAAATGAFATTGVIPGYIAAATANANYFGSQTLSIPNYAGTTGFKNGNMQSSYTSNAGAGTEVWASGFTWRNTAAITRVTLTPTAGNFIAGSRLTIYGIT